MSREAKIMLGIGGAVVIGLVALFIFNNRGPSTPSSTTADAATVQGSKLHQTGTGTKVTVVEFGDYECPACGEVEPSVQKLIQNYGDKITFVFRNYPLSIHPNAPISAEAAEAAGAQGKFWPMHDLLYAKQSEWASLSQSAALDKFVGYAQSLGLDTAKFKSDVQANAYAAVINADKADGDKLSLQGTPSFFINNQAFDPGYVPTYDQLTTAIDNALK